MKEKNGWSQFQGPVIEILSLVAAMIDEDETPVGILTARMYPEYGAKATNMFITQRQLIRLRNDINKILQDPQSWLYVPGDEENASNAEPPIGFNTETTNFNSPADS